MFSDTFYEALAQLMLEEIKLEENHGESTQTATPAKPSIEKEAA